MSTIAQESSLFEIDQELDLLLDEIQEQSVTEDGEEIPAELMIASSSFATPTTKRSIELGAS
jgi:hypothetical protein